MTETRSVLMEMLGTRLQLEELAGGVTDTRFAALLSQASRYAPVWRAGEGCRTDTVPVFEAVACDTPCPFTDRGVPA